MQPSAASISSLHPSLKIRPPSSPPELSALEFAIDSSTTLVLPMLENVCYMGLYNMNMVDSGEIVWGRWHHGIGGYDVPPQCCVLLTVSSHGDG